MNADCENLPGMIGRHPSMLEVYRVVRRVAPTTLPVVIVGETGTGKELVARAIHELSASRAGPFVDINCAAIPETLAEAELFGWERGAFTGAVHERRGLLELADEGTLFLDEACSLPQALQAKLLRAIEWQGFRRLGGHRTRSAAFRLVLAVSTPLESLLSGGTFRSDFAFRVAGATVHLPPLRDRGDDIVRLAEHFMSQGNGNGCHAHVLAPATEQALSQHCWKGNVRELKAAIQTATALSDSPCIVLSDLPGGLGGFAASFDDPRWLDAQLVARGWDVKRTARELGVGRTTLHALIRKHGLERASSVTT